MQKFGYYKNIMYLCNVIIKQVVVTIKIIKDNGKSRN
mgnify:CR=1 FL=1